MLHRITPSRKLLDIKLQLDTCTIFWYLSFWQETALVLSVNCFWKIVLGPFLPGFLGENAVAKELIPTKHLRNIAPTEVLKFTKCIACCCLQAMSSLNYSCLQEFPLAQSKWTRASAWWIRHSIKILCRSTNTFMKHHFQVLPSFLVHMQHIKINMMS